MIDLSYSHFFSRHVLLFILNTCLVVVLDPANVDDVGLPWIVRNAYGGSMESQIVGEGEADGVI